jgi:hypothetical protein
LHRLVVSAVVVVCRKAYINLLASGPYDAIYFTLHFSLKTAYALCVTCLKNQE